MWHLVLNVVLSQFSRKCYVLMWNVSLYTQWRCKGIEGQFKLKKYAHNITHYGVKKEQIVPWWCLHHITQYEVRGYCLLMVFVDVGNWHLFKLFIKGWMFITSASENADECSTTKSDSNWAYSHAHAHAWGSLTIGVGQPSTSFSSIGCSFKPKAEWPSLPHAKSTNSSMPSMHPSYHTIQD